MLTELRTWIAKASQVDGDEDQVFDLTNFDVQEVSNVDAPANEQPYLVIKGQLSMSSKALQQILSDGAGEFASTGAAPTPAKKDEGDVMPGAGEGEPGAGADEGTPAALRLSEAVKSETLQNLGVVIKALISVAKAVDAAEVATEGEGALPDDIKTIVRSSSTVLGKLLGEAPAAGAEGEAGKAVAAAAAGAVTKAKIDEFGTTLDTLGGVIDNLRTALGVKGAAAPAAAGAADASASAGDADVAKALDGITQLLKRQGGAITDLRERVGLPSALPAEGRRVSKSVADDDFGGWPLDMNEDRRQAART